MGISELTQQTDPSGCQKLQGVASPRGQAELKTRKVQAQSSGECCAGRVQGLCEGLIKVWMLQIRGFPGVGDL